MHDRHLNRIQYFNEQVYTTEKFVIPFIQQTVQINEQTSILEIGCGEGGNMKSFADLGCKITGIDLSERKIELAEDFFKDHQNRNNISFICRDIYDSMDLGKFDVIVLRDVIEHIPDQEKFMGFMKHFLHPESVIFFGFPPWQNPFGGHQQMCKSKILSKLPYFHLLPGFMFRGLLKLFGETPAKIKGLSEIRETGISIDKLERIFRNKGYMIRKRTLFFINPNYEIKFKLKPRIQSPVITSIPWVRNFFTTAAYYLVSMDRVQTRKSKGL